MTRPALVQSVFAPAIRAINALEQRIVTAEDDADAMLWDQAGQIVKQLDAGLSQPQLAAQWINVRTGEPYSQMHVSFTARVYREKFTFQPRPRFRDAYNELANAGKAHVAQNTGENEWYTPEDYITAARAVLGAIDLDPASTIDANRIVQARTFYTRADDGLSKEWRGRVWMNPPYAQPLVTQFCEKLAESVLAATVPAAIVLVNNATETEWFGTLADVCATVCFPTSRIQFWNPAKVTATPLQGQAVFYFGADVLAFHIHFASFGRVWVKP